MKKILFAAFAASLLATGCQKTEVYQPNTTGLEMTFSTEMKKITKAADPTATGFKNLATQGFNVWAYADFDISNSTNVDRTTGIYDGMTNWYVEGTLSNENVTAATWSARKQFYWPGKGKKLQFFAVSGSGKTTTDATQDNPSPISYDVDIYPQFAENITTTVTTTETVPTMTITNFTVGPKADDDLMVADFLTQDQESKEATNGTAGKVALNFRHALSKVQFVFKTPAINDGPSVYVQKLTVTNLKDKGNLKVQPAVPTATTKADPNVPVTTIVEPKWDPNTLSDTDPNTDFCVESTTPVSFTGENNVNIPIDFLLDTNNSVMYNKSVGDVLTPDQEKVYATWLMIPQELVGEGTGINQVEVFYLINNRQFKAIFPLIAKDKNQNEIDEWMVNKFTKYTITLSPNLITFDANVSQDWETVNEVEHQN